MEIVLGWMELTAAYTWGEKQNPRGRCPPTPTSASPPPQATAHPCPLCVGKTLGPEAMLSIGGHGARVRETVVSLVCCVTAMEP